ncbi:hypothetical protein ILUMI_13686 [Ignelater luminosus]|uniref:KANL2-like probable zinc-finger domain-containing protein n=1 Tax=Ignelater luminosus TaxID=2038154 RepID=A0A8K0G8E7_IGNLU|nr:hypothetical protein ILUMI_13686 [Ignelater luminosus]
MIITGISQGSENKFNKLHSSSKIRLKRNGSRNNYHESLQRIGGADPCYNHYQQYWFNSSLERLNLEDKSREERLEITRYELRRHLKQITKSNLGKADVYTEDTSLKSNYSISLPHRFNSHAGYDRLVSTRICDIEKCKRKALPCTRYCTLHIMHNADQVLFDYCTAKFADNTQCSVPVFDITHELPLCPEHARKRDNYRMYQETKPKKLRKKVKPSAMIRPQKRNKKKKRPVKPPEEVTSKPDNNSTVAEAEICDVTPDLSGDMVEQVLALQEPDGLELVSVEQALVTQASNLLEESEINNVLSTIQADEFNDFFTVNRNGEYEPTREETEELERALAAVDNDVKSLEKLSQSQGLLDSFLDEHTLVESLVQIPDVFHNGYAPCGDNIVTQTSRLLSVEPHSQS